MTVGTHHPSMCICHSLSAYSVATGDCPCHAAPDEPVINAAHLTRQRDFSLATFGPGARPLGIIDHIRKELDEITADPTDLGEWVDVAILAFDGALRAGHEPQAIIDAIKAKQSRNEARTWPDWRGMDPNKAIEHDRTGETPSEARP